MLLSEGRLQEALDKQCELIPQLEAMGDAARGLLAATMYKQAVTLHRVGNVDASLALLQDVSERFPDVSVAGKRGLAGNAQYLICRYNFRAGRYEAAVSAADVFVPAHLEDPDLADRVADALVTKSRCFLPDNLDRAELALAALDTVLERFSASEKPQVRRQVALAMYDKAALLRNSGRYDEAIRLWEAVFKHFRADLSGEALPFLAQAAAIEVLVETRQGRPAWEAAERLKECLEAPEHATPLLSEIARNVMRAANAMERAGMLREAFALFTAVADRLLVEGDVDLRTLGVYAQIDAGVMLGRLGDLSRATVAIRGAVGAGEPALAALNDIIERARTPRTGMSAEREPWAILMKGLVLHDLGRRSEAQMCLAEVVDRFGQDASPLVQLLVAKASEASAALSSTGKSQT